MTLVGVKCAVCGCTEDNPCLIVDGKRLALADDPLPGDLPPSTVARLEHGEFDVCEWAAVNLCTACSSRRPLLYDFAGRPLQ